MVLALVACATVGACGAQSKGVRRPVAGADREGVFRPESIRIHPLTRIVRREPNRIVIEAHVELFDAWGHPVKGLGHLRFEVSSGMPAGIGQANRPGSVSSLRAEVDLTDPEAASVQYYDSATRTYRMILDGENPTPSAPVDITATFIGLDDRVLRDTFTPGEGPRLSDPDETVRDVEVEAPPPAQEPERQ